MSTLRHAVATATDLACRAVGRRHVARAARFVLHRARLDIPNDLSTNGESSLQRWILELLPACREIHVFDVGANVGRWSSAMLVAARQGGRLGDLRLRAFEPSSYIFGCLSEELDGQPVSLRRVAVGERSGSAVLHVMAPGAGINSLYQPASLLPGVTTEEVATTTVDACADQAGLDQITLVKIDTEGHDLAVLRGARRLLAEHRILAVQFVYNHRWIAALVSPRRLRTTRAPRLPPGQAHTTRGGVLSRLGCRTGDVRRRQLPGLRPPGSRASAVRRVVEICQLRNVR